MNCYDVKIQNCMYVYYKINKGDTETSNYKIMFSTIRQSRDSSNDEGETDSHSCTRSVASTESQAESVGLLECGH